MTSLERMLKTLNHEQPDRTPVYPLVSGVTRQLNNSTYFDWANDANICADALLKAQQFLETDCICTLTDLSVEASDFGQEIIYPEKEAAYPSNDNHLIKTVEDYDKITKINPRDTPRMSEHIKLCEILVDKKGKDTPIIAFVFGPLGILSMLRGQSNLYMDLYDCPDKVKKALQVITDVLIDYCQALTETKVHSIMFDTLFASQSIMSKEMWLEFEGPYVQRLAQYVHSKNCMVMIHNCGDGIYFDAQIEMMNPEAISFNHIPDDCKSYEETKEKYGNLTTLIGTIDPAWLVNAKPEDLEKACKQQIDMFGRNGGYVLATGCEYPANLSLDKARLMCSVARKYNPFNN